MERIINFRGKRVDGKGWAWGFYATNGSGKHWIVVPAMFSDVYSFVFIEVYPETVGQFSGIVDSMGVDIFEGDELLYTTKKGGMSNMVVKFNDGCFVGEGPFLTRPLFQYLEALDFESIQVISNCSDNPELLHP